MKYAIVNGQRQEAQPRLPGTCPCCDSPVIPKCGKIRMHHWAHRRMCDPWWEIDRMMHLPNSQKTLRSMVVKG